MNYKKLGNTDIDISTICLGTMTWGEQNTQNEAFDQMHYALDQGVNLGYCRIICCSSKSRNVRTYRSNNWQLV